MQRRWWEKEEVEGYEKEGEVQKRSISKQKEKAEPRGGRKYQVEAVFEEDQTAGQAHFFN